MATTHPIVKPSTYHVGQAGEYFVLAELHRRGANAVKFSGNLPSIDLIAIIPGKSQHIEIQVKTKRTGTWQTSIKHGTEGTADYRFWVLVDIGTDTTQPPKYYIIPDLWMRKHIVKQHKANLAKHGGRRKETPESTHSAIKQQDVENDWHNRWDLLFAQR